MQETVILEAPPAEEGVEGVHRLLLWDTLSAGAIDVGCALGRQCGGVRQLYVSVRGSCLGHLPIHTHLNYTTFPALVFRSSADSHQQTEHLDNKENSLLF